MPPVVGTFDIGEITAEIRGRALIPAYRLFIARNSTIDVIGINHQITTVI
jgi:hypothetical protein